MSEYGYAEYLREAHDMIDAVDAGQVKAVCDAIESSCRRGKTLFVCGNGGSAANASHFAEDMATLMLDPDSDVRLKTMALTDAGPFIMAVANDFGYEQIFERQLMVNASAGDVLVSISGSGNSPNVLRATEWAANNGLTTIGVTGYDGGKLGPAVDHELRVASYNMGMLECVHLLLLDFIVKELRFRVRGIEHQAR
jgi:D-sedoheptulose 7-phosphate isomerase